MARCTRCPNGAYTLTLTQEEAETLSAGGWRIGGHPRASRRGHFDRITSALRNAMRGHADTAEPTDMDDALPSTGSSIYFTNTR